MTVTSSPEQQLLEYKAILDHAGVAVTFTRNRLTYRCNPLAEELFGWPAGTLVGQPGSVYFRDADAYARLSARAIPVLTCGQFLDLEIEMARRDGSTFMAHLIAGAINAAAPRSGTVWIIRDITQEVSAREENARLLREQQLIFDNAQIGISYQRGRIILRCNRRLEEIFDHPPGSLDGQSTRALFCSEQDWEAARSRVYSEVSAEVSAERTFDGELRYCRRDGTPIQVHIVGRTIVSDEGGDTWIWTYQDVSRRYQAEEALRQSNIALEQRVADRTAELSQQLHLMQQLIEAIPGPIFYKDAQSRYLGCNSAFTTFIGASAQEVIGKGPHDIAPPALADKYLAADRVLLEQPGAQIYESPVRYASGEMRDVLFHKATFFGADGKVGGMVGFMLDITERKRMEARLQQAATVFDSSAEGVTITAPDGTIIAVNRAFTEITGYSEAEVLGRNSRLLQSGRQDRYFYRDMWNAMGRVGRWQGELWNRRKDGKIYPVWLTVSAVKDSAGTLTHYVGVFSDITAIKTAYEKINHLAHHDALTGLPNRLLLEDRLLVALQRARRDQSGLAVLFLDLDRFKVINDSLGHEVGDRVLCEVAQRLGSLIRESDTVARLGGDEFLILMEGLGDPTAASNVAEKVLENLSKTPLSLEQEFFVGVSIGISLFPQDGEDSATLVKHADVAMYRSKQRGRNTYEFFTPELTGSSLERFKLETDLRRAVEREELRIYLQPQFSLSTGALIGAEALVRWQHPELGLVMPGKFIGLAEESGLIVEIGEWVQGSACRDWAGWVQQGLDPGMLSINVSGVEFRRGRIQETVRRVLAATRLPPALLELEITESAIMSQAESSIEVLHELRAMGLSLAIDDFGTGYSSLAYLKRLPLNKLKIDQSFVRGLPTDAEDCAITRAVIALGHSLQLTIIAEGVETQAQSQFLTREGCDEMQGYLRGKPMPVDEFRRQFLSS